MSLHRADIDRLESHLASALRDSWRFLLIEGVILAVLGIAAIVVPPVATLAVEIILGWLFLASGMVGLVMTFLMRRAPRFWWSLLSAVGRWLIDAVAEFLAFGRHVVPGCWFAP